MPFRPTRAAGGVAYAGRVVVAGTDNLEPRSLVWATDIDVLPADRTVARGDGYLVVRSPSNPAHYWGNLLLFDDPPGAGDVPRWERLFDAELGRDPRIRHRTFAWDRIDGALGCAPDELGARGYQVEAHVGLIAAADQVRAHARENRAVVFHALDPTAGADEERWDAVVELQVAAREAGFEEAPYRAFTRTRQAERRVLFRAGRGSWYVALAPGTGEVVGSCGVVVTGSRGRFQAVDTAAPWRRRGVCSRLIVEAARHSAAVYGTERLVIVAAADYHARGLYESLGFEPAEHVRGACRSPRSAGGAADTAAAE